MRDNGPITNREIEMKDGQMLVSRTDTGGRITFVNKAFIDISGFDEAELIGAPHNVVRHPGMPKEAFSDLWAAIKVGRPWEGMVKNRTKTGDHYWVRANVTPTTENGQVTGFVSIRSKPSRAQVNEADKAYELFRSGRAAGLAITDGRVISTTLGGRLNRWFNTIAGRLNVTLAALVAIMILVGGIGYAGMGGITLDMKAIYEENTVPAIDLAQIADLYQENYRQLAIVEVELLRGEQWRPLAERLAEIKGNSEKINKLWDVYWAQNHPAEERQLGEAFISKRHEFRESGLAPAIEMATKGDVAALGKHMGEHMRAPFEAAHTALVALIEYQRKDAGGTFAQSQSHANRLALQMVLVLLVAVVVAVVAGLWLLRTIRTPMTALERHFDAIAAGNMTYDIPPATIGEFNQIHSLLRAMKAKLGYGQLEKAELDRKAEEARRAELARVAQSLEDRVKDVVSLIDISSGSLLGNAQTLSRNAQETMVQAGSVTAMTGQVTANVQSVSAATQELSSSVTEISRQVAHSATISSEAVRQAGETDRQVQGLAQAAQKIGEVVNLINDIASQTNLLALNATMSCSIKQRQFA